MDVIVYTTIHGNVAVCVPSGEVPLEEVLAKDAPEGAIVVDNASLPWARERVFNAWRLVDGAVVVDEEHAAKIEADKSAREATISLPTAINHTGDSNG